MKVLIVSDTHGREYALEKIVRKVGAFDRLLHLGDVEGGEERIREIVGSVPADIIAGNNDFFCDLPNDRTLMIGRYKVWMTHGHRYFVHGGPLYIKEEARKRGVDVVMYGHTHRPYLEVEPDLTVLNPGSVSLPRQENRKSSFAIMELDRDGEAHYTIGYL